MSEYIKDFFNIIKKYGLPILNTLSKGVLEIFRMYGEVVQNDVLDIGGPVGQAIENWLNTKNAGITVDDYMKRHPNTTREQAVIEMYKEWGVISPEGYDLIMRKKNKKNFLNYKTNDICLA